MPEKIDIDPVIVDPEVYEECGECLGDGCPDCMYLGLVPHTCGND